MQTFLPYPDFAESARVLDLLRLGKQRVETLQLLNALFVEGHGYRHHPAAKMWRGWEPALATYGLVICARWVELGRADTCAAKIEDRLGVAVPALDQLELPAWLGEPAFHAAHQSSLLRKDPDHYGPLFPGVPDDLPYVWPAGRY